MLFTSHRSIAGKPAANARSLPYQTLVSESVINWSPVSICLSAVGSRSWQYGLPGFADYGCYGSSSPCDRTPAQIQVRMKNTRKETGLPASDKLRPQGPLPAYNPDDQALFENQVFTEKQSPRQPESPDVESLRSLLKANMTREKASPALLHRIRSRMQENKE